MKGENRMRVGADFEQLIRDMQEKLRKQGVYMSRPACSNYLARRLKDRFEFDASDFKFKPKKGGLL